jgi:hypothetical protein
MEIAVTQQNEGGGRVASQKGTGGAFLGKRNRPSEGVSGAKLCFAPETTMRRWRAAQDSSLVNLQAIFQNEIVNGVLRLRENDGALFKAVKKIYNLKQKNK